MHFECLRPGTRFAISLDIRDRNADAARARDEAKAPRRAIADAELFAAIQQKFGGQAEAYGNITSASIFKVKDSIDEWKESIGASLGPAQGFIALLPGMSAGLSGAGAAAGGWLRLMERSTGSRTTRFSGWA